MKAELIRKSINTGTQSLSYEELYRENGHTLKIDIKSDSYRFQCHAYIWEWSDATDNRGPAWTIVDTIHFSNMKTPKGLQHQSNPSFRLFELDTTILKDTARLILN